MYPSSRAYRPSKPGMLSTCGALSLLSVAPVPIDPSSMIWAASGGALCLHEAQPSGSPAKGFVTQLVRTLVQSCGEAVEGEPGRNAGGVLVKVGLHITHAAGRFIRGSGR